MITYKHSGQLAFSPAFTFVFKGYADMLEKKLTHPALEFGNQHEVVWACDDERVIAAQVFQVDKIGRAYTIMAYVDPEYRGRELAVELFKHLETVLKRRLGSGLKAVYTSAVDENMQIHRVFEKTGRDQYTSKFAKMYGEA